MGYSVHAARDSEAAVADWQRFHRVQYWETNCSMSQGDHNSLAVVERVIEALGSVEAPGTETEHPTSNHRDR